MKLVERPKNGQVVILAAQPRQLREGDSFRGIRLLEKARSAGLAEVFDPANEGLVIGRLDIEEFHAYADARLNNADDPQGFDGLFFVAEGDAHSGLQRQGLTGADEAAAHGDIGGDTGRTCAGFEVEKLGIRGKGVANGVAAVADGQSSTGASRSTIVHGYDVAHRAGNRKRTAHSVREVPS